MSNHQKYTAAKDVLVKRLGAEMVVYDRTSCEAHLLQSEHIEVFENIESDSLEALASRLFPEQSAAEGLNRVESLVQQLLDKRLLVSDTAISRRDFSKSLAALPAILTFAASLPAAADSLGMWDSDTDGMIGVNSVMVPTNSMSINFTSRGGSGGGGGGGGRAIDDVGMGMTIEGADGGIGAFGVEVSGTGAAVTAGSTLTVNVGGGGMGGQGGQDGDGLFTNPFGGSGGAGGAGGAPTGSSGMTGNDGGGDANLDRGGGGGGGGQGGDSEIVGIAGSLGAGGTGGGGGEGGMGGMGMVANMVGAAGTDGNAGGAGGASGGTATDGGDGGGNPTATPTADSATGTGGTGSPGSGGAGGFGGSGGDGEDGRVVIVFCP